MKVTREIENLNEEGECILILVVDLNYIVFSTFIIPQTIASL